MKKLMVMILALGITAAASAQKVAVGFRGHYGGWYYHPRTTFVVGAYAPYYNPYYGYYPYYPYYRYANRPTKLDLEIADIKNDYDEKISAARHDKSVPGKERRANIRQLKHDRDQAIIDAQRAYYKR